MATGSGGEVVERERMSMLESKYERGSVLRCEGAQLSEVFK